VSEQGAALPGLEDELEYILLMRAPQGGRSGGTAASGKMSARHPAAIWKTRRARRARR